MRLRDSPFIGFEVTGVCVFQVRNELSDRKRIFKQPGFPSHFVYAAMLVASIASVAPAGAAVYWTDDDPMAPREIMVPDAAPAARISKPRRTGANVEKTPKEYAKPVGPLVIAISIQHQTLRVFDANGLFAKSPVSTGVSGHATPMGVFSVIQKNKWHRSNIYSGAPMPYMQRITWSGIALHAGVVPGHPASHGCIRMPEAFAVKMWGWTRMGARVIITPGEISPTEVTHPLLLAQKPTPAPTAAIDVKDIVTTPKADKTAVDVKPAIPAEVKTKTADASSAMVPAAPDARPPAPDTKQTLAAKSEDKVVVTRRDVDDAVARTVELPAPQAKPAQVAAEAPVTGEPAVPSTALPTAPPAAEARKDETRPADAGKAEMSPTATEVAPKRRGQIAVLISARDKKLYVRQNFAPLFETAITIKPSDRPLGTHVFTARLDKADAGAFHWSAVSLPAAPQRADDEDRAVRRHKSIGAIEVNARPLPDSAAEALDRVTIPAEAATQIADALASGGSIIVSDQGIAAGGETGEGTEFVVPLR
jgi:lipoprotein-anchoring transpeptidase ErfK/SrfK